MLIAKSTVHLVMRMEKHTSETNDCVSCMRLPISDARFLFFMRIHQNIMSTLRSIQGDGYFDGILK